MSDTVVAELLARAHRLGSDPRNTNFAGGNASAKATARDPITGSALELLWVKGSGGDLGTLTEDGLAVLRLDRLRAMTGVYPGPAQEDRMVALFDYARHGSSTAAPSIDTAMHGLLTAAHVDHLHPDAGIALATAADGPDITAEIFGDRVLWVPWRRPGFQLGLDIAAIEKANPQAIGVILGGHGITAWGPTSAAAESNSLEIIRAIQRYIDDNGRPEPFGPPLSGYQPLPQRQRRAKAAALAPHLRRLVSTDHRRVGHFTDHPEVLEFLAARDHPDLAALGTSCPDHFLRTRIRPLVLDLPSDADAQTCRDRLTELHRTYRDEYRAYYERYADESTPPMRGADPAIVLVPGVGMFSYGPDKHTARIAGEYYRNAIAAMRGAQAISRYQPIGESEKFRIEYWELEQAKLARLPAPKPLAGRVALITGAASGIGLAIARRFAAEGACVAIADRDGERAREAAAGIGSADVATSITADVTDEGSIEAAIEQCLLAFGGIDIVVNNAGLSLSKRLADTTTADWDLQHDVMARGSFLVSRAAAAVLVEQGMGGDIVYICSKNAVVAGPNNIAYASAKADQAHQVRLLAAELGESGIKVNGVNPDAVVQGSGIFAGGWGAERAAVYGVAESELGAFYADRTLLKREVLPDHVAAAAFALCAGDFARTTGLLVPVDAGVSAAFLR